MFKPADYRAVSYPGKGMSIRRLPLYFCDHHALPLPEGHKFPLKKYRMVRQLLHRDGRFQLREAPLATEQDLRRVHAEVYIQGFLQGTLDRAVLRRIGFPWSEGLVKRTLASTGGTLAATRTALETGFSGTVAGGTHHAFRSEGAGFCVFNDLAVAAEWARQCRGVTRIAIVDLDVHQGDGTASIFENDAGIFTLSLHGARNFPFRKQRSRLDVEFADGAQAEQYFPALNNALSDVWRFEPELILFQSGVDGLASDRLGRMSLTLEDLAQRDRIVFGEAARRNLPIVVTMGGGYSDPIERTAQAHAQTFQTAADMFTIPGNAWPRATIGS
ncbi:MAG: histone deacetylase superfamily [Bryobacterales bacterium]|nr:histone deacetylase superfamily [Bryobacterales bacterium]